MGDAGTMSVAAQDTLTGAGVQTVTGAKTFAHQTLKMGNAAATFVATYQIPAITANTPTILADTFLTKFFKYLVFIDPNDATTPYHGVNQITGLSTKSAAASTLLQTVFTDSANAAVFIADGTYLCLANITVPTGIQIIGQSRENTILKADTGWAGPTINFLTNANTGVNTGNSNIMLANLTVDANNLAKDCVHFDRVWRSRVTNCHFKGARGFTFWWWGDLSTDTTPIIAKENQFDNNILDCATGTLDVFGGGRMTDSVIGPNNVFRDSLVSGPSGLVVQTNAIRLLVTGNHIFNTTTTGSGISLEAGHFCTVSNNIIHDIVGVGINLPMSPSGRGVQGSLTGNPNHCFVYGNNIRDTGAGVSAAGHGHVINNNYIEGCLQQGIASSAGGTDGVGATVNETDPGQIQFNQIINCGKNTGAGASTRAGIQVDGSTGLLNSNIIGNVIYDNQTTPTMNYGIYESSPSDGNIIAFNNISTNMLLGAIRRIGTNTQVKFNRGYVTNAYGTSTQSGNASTKVFNIAHGLVAAPTKFVVSPGSADAIGPPYVTADATNVIVTFPTAPPTGTNNLVFRWLAEVYQ